MKHFRSIDGLRAWLAWLVVFAHVAVHTAADIRWHWLEPYFSSLAPRAVQIFIIISGFVITHLLLERREPYVPYITRRFLRIYPIYFVCLCLGILAMYLHIDAFADAPWGADMVPQADLLSREIQSLQDQGLVPHLIAHLLLLHGLVSNNVLPMSEYMFLGPAWSLSLEWQFYLVAPLVVYCLRSRANSILLGLVTLAAYLAYRRGVFGDFYDPSILPGAGVYFATGIATRYLYSRLPKFTSYPFLLVILAVVPAVFFSSLIPVVFWVAFVAWLRVEQPRNRLSVAINGTFNWAFNSRFARYLGIRSYSTYLIHEPIIHIIVYVCIRQFSMALLPTAVVTLLLTVPLTLLASAVLYRYVESPAIDYGKRLFNREPVPESA